MHDAQMVLALQNKKETPPSPEPPKPRNEGQTQMKKFGYDPIALGKPVKTKQVVGFIEQPWYTRLMNSGSFQVDSNSLQQRLRVCVYVQHQPYHVADTWGQ